MKTSNRYIEMLAGTCLRLWQRDGIRDPSGPEIACKTMGQPLPDHPATWPDYLGGEIYGGVLKRLSMIRAVLEERGHLCSPVGYRYYQHGMRGRDLEEDEVFAALPSGGARNVDENGNPVDNRPYGLRFIVEGEEDPIYVAYKTTLGQHFITGLDRTGQRLLKANKIGVIADKTGMAIADTLESRLTIGNLSELKRRIKNGTE